MRLSKWIVGCLTLIAFLGTSTPLFSGARVGVGVGISVGHVRRHPAVVHGRVGVRYVRIGHGFHTHVPVANRTVNVGRVDFNVSPVDSEIYVDGGFLSLAKDVNGGFFGSTAALQAGTHGVRVVSPDGQVVTRKIHVMPAREMKFNLTF